ncbi:MAG: GTPase ObgE [Elusimicrobiota bacterium]|jgi:GTP-binding protein|nr:GTPase ObgE [Elusimicrobiota bacterium]
MFLDIVKIFVKSGKGGDGCISFHKEKYVEFGGPDGGNGGKGGDVYIIGDKNYQTLYDFTRNRHFEAKDGAHGKGSNKNGKNGENLYIKVPLGTQIFIYNDEDKTKTFKADILKHEDKVKVASGGIGGRGNATFKTHNRTAPRIAQRGEPGEVLSLIFELKLIANIGLLGYPNAGKSTFLSSTTKAKPKIADYPFTTLSPNLGVIEYYDQRFIIADIPGIVEGAYKGVGLGLDFLRHIERTKLLFHLLDINGYENETNIYNNFTKMNKELYLYNQKLVNKKQIVLITKMDTFVENKKNRKELDKLKNKIKIDKKFKILEIFEISSLSKLGIDEFLKYVYKIMKVIETEKVENDILNNYNNIPEIKYESDFKVEKINDIFYIKGKKIEKITAMTYLEEPEAIIRFQNILKKMGVETELKKHGINEGDLIIIGDYKFNYVE